MSAAYDPIADTALIVGPEKVKVDLMDYAEVFSIVAKLLDEVAPARPDWEELCKDTTNEIMAKVVLKRN